MQPHVIPGVLMGRDISDSGNNLLSVEVVKTYPFRISIGNAVRILAVVALAVVLVALTSQQEVCVPKRGVEFGKKVLCWISLVVLFHSIAPSIVVKSFKIRVAL